MEINNSENTDQILKDIDSNFMESFEELCSSIQIAKEEYEIIKKRVTLWVVNGVNRYANILMVECLWENSGISSIQKAIRAEYFLTFYPQ